MSKYSGIVAEAANDSIVATGGLDKQGLTGAYRGLVWTKEGFSFPSITAAKDIDTWNTAIAAGNIIPIGDGEFTDQSTDATFYERAALNIRIKQTNKIKALQFEYAVNACTRAELEKMEGKSGRVFTISENSILEGVYNDDGTVQGKPLSSIDVDDVEPTEDAPVKTTTVTMTFSDPKGDIRNPFQSSIDFGVQDLDQVFSVAPTVANEASNGSALSADITLVDALGNTALTGAVLADFSAEDEDGNALTIASVTETGSTGVYAISITTALTKAYVSFNGIRSIGGVLTYLGPTLVTTA